MNFLKRIAHEIWANDHAIWHVQSAKMACYFLTCNQLVDLKK